MKDIIENILIKHSEIRWSGEMADGTQIPCENFNALVEDFEKFLKRELRASKSEPMKFGELPDELIV